MIKNETTQTNNNEDSTMAIPNKESITAEQITEIVEYAEFIAEKHANTFYGPVSSYEVYRATEKMVNRRAFLRGISDNQVRAILATRPIIGTATN